VDLTWNAMFPHVTSVLTTKLRNRAIDFGWKTRCYEKSEKRYYKLVLG
jgi:hypothetical protein